MSKQKVSLDELDHIFAGILDEVIEEEQGNVTKAVRETARDTVNSLKHDFPDGAGVYHAWDDYASGWSSTTRRDVYGGIKMTIRNKDKYMLTHLLEKGHLNQDGTMSKAFPHIEPAAEAAFEEIERKLKNGD